jgi:hypothetical protein
MSLPPELANVGKRPSMYLRVNTYDVAVAFVDGYDFALSGGLLVGFREWLIVRVDGADNMAWTELVLLTLGDPEAQGEQSELIKGLFRVLEEFMAVRDVYGGLRRIYAAYEKWLQRQDWYKPTDPDWIAP